MFFVNITDDFSFIFIFLWAGHFSPPNLICVQKPDRTIVIFCKFAPHLEYFNIVHLLDEIAHFETLLQTVTLIVTLLQHCDFIATATVVVLNGRILLITTLLLLGSWGVKVYHYRLTDTCTTPDSGLNESQPIDFLGVAQILL
jgi:hypothetical protein